MSMLSGSAALGTMQYAPFLLFGPRVLLLFIVFLFLFGIFYSAYAFSFRRWRMQCCSGTRNGVNLT